jgi:hypothetical protein
MIAPHPPPYRPAAKIWHGPRWREAREQPTRHANLSINFMIFSQFAYNIADRSAKIAERSRQDLRSRGIE